MKDTALSLNVLFIINYSLTIYQRICLNLETNEFSECNLNVAPPAFYIDPFILKQIQYKKRNCLFRYKQKQNNHQEDNCFMFSIGFFMGFFTRYFPSFLSLPLHKRGSVRRYCKMQKINLSTTRW